MREVFDYFMAQVFRDVAAASRAVLVETAVLPRFTESMAVALSGDPSAGEAVESLYRRHLFVERRYGSEITYQYHVLFRAFLLDEARRMRTPDAMAELSRRAAALLEAAGAREDALRLLLEGGDRHRAADLLEKLASDLVAAGRGAALREWFAKLSERERDARPWLSYWLGTSFIGVSLPDARAAYERAYRGFIRAGDRAGQTMAIAGLFQIPLFAMSDSLPLPQWLSKLEPLLAEEPKFSSSALAARVYGTLVGVMTWMAPASPMFPLCVSRLEKLLAEPLEDDDVKVTAAGQLAEYYAIAGLVPDATRIIGAFEPLARRGDVSPVAQAYWCIRTSRRDYAVGELPIVRAKLERALAIVTEHHLQHGIGVIYGELAEAALETGDLDEASSVLEQMRARAAHARHPGIVGRLHILEAKYAALRGELADARRHAEQACSESLASLSLTRMSNRRALASILMVRGELDEARTVLETTAQDHSRERFPQPAFTYQALNALLAAARVDLEGLRHVQDGLRQLQTLGVGIPLRGNRLAAGPLAELLVRHRVELPYVTAWIRRVKLKPSSPDVPNWPWPVRVRTLGEFSVELDGVPLRFNGKAPRRPLELLQAIVAFGGKEIRSETLCDALWPDSDGDTAQSALRLTLSRLRKLLKRDAVVQRRGKISIDADSCWVDLWSFRNVCAQIDAAPRDCAAARLLDLYRGAFLQHEREEAWMLPVRVELRQRFAAAIDRLGRALESGGRDGELAVLRLHAAQRDDLGRIGRPTRA
jgi:DNA-binding SARP family transcriptional activator